MTSLNVPFIISSYLKVLLAVNTLCFTHTDKWKSNLCPPSQLIIQLSHHEGQEVIRQFKLREDSSIAGAATWRRIRPRMHRVTRKNKAVDSWWRSGNSSRRKFSPGEWTETTNAVRKTFKCLWILRQLSARNYGGKRSFQIEELLLYWYFFTRI